MKRERAVDMDIDINNSITKRRQSEKRKRHSMPRWDLVGFHNH